MIPEVNGAAISEKSAFRQAAGVAISITSKPERLWSLLTHAAGIPRWTSTVTEISGSIAAGATLTIKVPYSKRLFKVRVDEFEPARRLVWSDGNFIFRGVRTYTLSPALDGSTTFTLVEVFTGAMLPLIAPSLPDFKPIFSQYAADLKKAAEKS